MKVVHDNANKGDRKSCRFHGFGKSCDSHRGALSRNNLLSSICSARIDMNSAVSVRSRKERREPLDRNLSNHGGMRRTMLLVVIGEAKKTALFDLSFCPAW